ncbi:MAG: magnesium transporter [Xanthomonadales bacterium]|nr:magnesium transporter [Gammaproteobacteria bacterium]MBT8053068.1 magnesium transporter [Gammaproteobacteria bacterium]NND56688.1 magnesium transporter [Xanthomonadales bacterium]NNK52673.1 magnesium transporter [Xanthomonadales bacterium]NNL95344.1 magnesium transporter [Xanthomonadales bacterium]
MAEQHLEEKTARHLDRLSAALDSGKRSQVSHLIKNLSGAEIGDLLESLPLTKRLAVWELTDPELDGDVLVEVNDEVRASLIRGTSAEDLVAAVDDLDLDDLADILDDLPDAVTLEVLRSLDRQDRERLAQVMSYPEDSAGGLMDPDVLTIRPDVTLDVVLRYLRARGELPDVFDLLFVVDRRGRYLGSLKLSNLLTQDINLTVGELMDTSAVTIPVDMHENQVAMEFEHHDLVTAPVIDADRHLLGWISIDDVVDVIREQAEHSILSRAGLDEEEDMFAPIVQSARRRWVWLGVNLITAIMAALVLYAFEPTLDQLVATAVLFPIVMSMGGIAGTQTLTLMVRGMATGQVSASNTPALLRKEVAVGLLNGVVFSIVIAVIAMLWYNDLALGLVMAAAILLNLVAGALAGALVPVVLKRMSIDPALAGGVVLTTVTDVIGILAFIGLATFLLLGR